MSEVEPQDHDQSAVLDTASTTDAAPADEPRRPASMRAFVTWGVAGYLVATGLLVAASLMTTDGTLIYLIDDPAIHLSIAETLADSGTWGVVPGQFQSASSSPVWTVLLTGAHLVVPFAFNLAPLLFNMASAIALIVVLGASQNFLRPGRDRPLDGPAVAVITVVVLFLPALTMLGMEHILHMALVVAVLALFARRNSGVAGRLPAWAPYALLAVASLVRFETAFLAVGLAAATLVVPGDATRRRSARERVVTSVGILAASAIPLIVFAVFNRAMGQGWLPNSILAKGQGISGDSASSFAPVAVVNRLTTDPLVLGLTLLALVALVVGWGQRRFLFPAVAFVVTVVLHVTLASIGWFDRYQAYLIALGVFVGLQIGAEVRSLTDPLPAPRRLFRPALLVVVLLLLSATKVSLTWHVTRGVADTYKQRYQAALFLEEYYDGESIATGELGYISLLHDGPITDLFGLADWEVLEERREQGQQVPSSFWAQLAVDRDFDVVAVYPLTLWFDTPDEWILVGTWTLEDPTITAFQNTFQFWATKPSEVAPLQEHLTEFQEQMPDGVSLELNDLATYRAEEQLAGG